MNDFSKQIEDIVNAIHVVKGKDILLSKNTNAERQNEAILKKLLELGLDIDPTDVKLLLTYYIYYNYYVWPPSGLEKCKNDKPDISLVPVDNLTYEDATGLRTDYWADSYWKYAKPEVDHEFSTKQVLRKGSQGQWVGNGKYVETSVITSDDDPTLDIHQHTHTFAFGSRVGNYNWIYGQNLPDDDNKGSVRFYIHLSPYRASAALLAREIQKGFDLYEIPFTFKFLTFAEDYQCRSDTAILYVSRKHLYVTIYLIANIYNMFKDVGFTDTGLSNSKVNPILLPETPQFAYRLCYGIAFAENPENNDSFGMNRCKLLAEALLQSDIEYSEDRFKRVKEILEIKRFRINEFYKNPDSPTNYEFIFSIFRSVAPDDVRNYQHNKGSIVASNRSLAWNGYRRIKIRLSDEAEWFGKPGIYRRKYLVAAVRIAIRLCKEAIWYSVSDQSDTPPVWKCNWLSYTPNEKKDKGYQYQMLSTNQDFDVENQLGVGADSVREFLRKIYKNYYESDLFYHTAERTDVVENLTPERNIAPIEWEDNDIIRAWEQINPDITQKLPKDQVERLADFIIERFINAGRPLGNGFKTEDPKTRELFCANTRFGLSGLGRFFLYVYEL